MTRQRASPESVFRGADARETERACAPEGRRLREESRAALGRSGSTMPGATEGAAAAEASSVTGDVSTLTWDVKEGHELHRFY